MIHDHRRYTAGSGRIGFQQNPAPGRNGNILRGYVGAAILGRHFVAARRRYARAGYEFKSSPNPRRRCRGETVKPATGFTGC
jgi:hypothetical protein